MSKIILIHNGFTGIVSKLKDKLTTRIRETIPNLQVKIMSLSYTGLCDFHIECDEMIYLHPAEKKMADNIPWSCFVIPMLQKGHKANKELRINALEYTNNDDNEALIESLCGVILNKIGIIKYSRKIFISYKRSESKRLAEKIRKELAIEGFSVFLDTRDIDVGTDFMQEIRLSIADSDVFLMIDSRTYYESEYTKKELFSACISGTAIVVLSDSQHKNRNLNGLNRVIIKEKDRFTKEDKKELIHTIQKVCNEVWVARHQRLNRRIESFHEKEVFLQGVYVPMKSTRQKCSLCAIYMITGLPNTIDFQRIQQHGTQFNNENKHNSGVIDVYALYDDLTLPASYSKHLKWLDKEMPHINLIKTSSFESDTSKILKHSKMMKNIKPIVFLSASIPNEDDNDYNFLKIHDIIVTLTETVIKSGGTLVFGGHPTITPIILNIMEIMAENDEGVKQYPNIYLYQSEFFKTVFPPETKAFPKERLEIVPIVAVDDNLFVESEKESTDKQLSLALMRERMINAYSYTSAIFIGGRFDKDKGVESSGVWDEYEKFSEKHPDAKCLYLEKTGIVPMKLAKSFSNRIKKTTIENLPIELCDFSGEN